MLGKEKIKKYLKKHKINFLEDECLFKHTNFKIGGKCDLMCFPNSAKQLIRVIKYVKKERIKYYILGNGTNVLCSDDGFNGIIIKLGNNFKKAKVLKNGIKVQSGMNLFELNRLLAKNNFSGLEFSYGIPGSIGGAIFMNAGADNKAIGYFVNYVKVFDGKKIRKLKQKDCDFSYRHSIIKEKGYIVLEAVMNFEQGKQMEIENLQQEYLQKRLNTQPYHEACAGSIFKRLEDGQKPVSKMIDELGLKGTRQNDAEISTIHAGFIVNKAKATCKDVIYLIKYIREKIKSSFNQDISLEIELVGDMYDFEG